MSVEKKVALVTGSSSGIGLACVHSLAKRGVDVIITGSRDVTLVGDILEDIKKYDVRVNYVSADLSKLTDIDKLWSEVTRLYPDGIDILVNNAGIGHCDSTEYFPDDKWDQSISVSLSAPFHLTKRCLPAMKKKGWGRIINMSSIYGLVALPLCPSYLAAKHGLIGLTKGVALENAALGVTCNAVCPAYVSTPMLATGMDNMRALMSTDLSLEDYLEKHVVSAMPTKALITSEQVAELVEFLCLSNASSQITGASYLIDGGFTAQ